MAKNKGLEAKQAAFCREYIKDLNATQAAIRAGYSQRTANRLASHLLSKVDIQNEISSQIEAILEQSKVPLKKQLFNYWMKRAFYDVTEIIDLQGEIKLTEEQLREKGLYVCIDSVNKKINAQGETIITYQFADKDKAADMLQKYIQMIKEQPLELTGSVILNILNQEHSLS